MITETMIQKISGLPDAYYTRLSVYVDSLIDEVSLSRERELEAAIEQSRNDIASGDFSRDLAAHLVEVGCV